MVGFQRKIRDIQILSKEVPLEDLEILLEVVDHTQLLEQFQQL